MIGGPSATAVEPGHANQASADRPGISEGAAALLLGVANLGAPLVAWCAGTVLLHRSQCWSVVDKRRGSVVGLAAGVAALLMVTVRGAPAFALFWIPVLTTLLMAWRLRPRTRERVTPAIGLLTVILTLPVLIGMLPPRAYQSLSRAQNGAASVTGAGARDSGCRDFYGDETLNWPLGTLVEVRVTDCVNGHRVTWERGPDCTLSGGAAAYQWADVAECTMAQQADGTAVLHVRVATTPVTSVLLRRTTSNLWVFYPSGAVVYRSGD